MSFNMNSEIQSAVTEESRRKEEISSLIRQITMSGRRQIDTKLSKNLKAICRQSDEYVQMAYHELVKQLEKNHAEIRLSAFQMISDLFDKSHFFRNMLLEDFQKFMDLTIETDYELPLPPPVAVAKELKASVLKTIHQWHLKYGAVYKQLDLGYVFLKNCKQINFNDIQANSLAEIRREEAQQARRNRIQQQRIERTVLEMNESEDELRTVQIQLENCLKLLIPPPEEFFPTVTDDFGDDKRDESVNSLAGGFFVATDSDDKCDDKMNGIVEHSRVSKNMNVMATNETLRTADKFNLNIYLSKDVTIYESPDNIDLLRTYYELISVIERKLKSAQKWLEVLTQCGSEQSCIRRALQMRSSLELLKNRTRKLVIIKSCSSSFVQKATTVNQPLREEASDMSSDDSDEDFIEVPSVKEGLEYPIPAHRRAEYGLINKPSSEIKRPKRKANDDADHDPTSWCATLKKLKSKLKCVSTAKDDSVTSVDDSSEQELSVNCERDSEKMTCKEKMDLECSSDAENNESVDRKNRLLDKAPVLPFNTDLYHWGEDNVTLPLKTKVDSEKFWHPVMEDDGDVVDKVQLELMQTRCITYAGQFEPVKFTCRAPLANGKLCPRRDRVKCPFHGKIIARDDMGQPIDAEDVNMSQTKCSDKNLSVHNGAGTSSAYKDKWNDSGKWNDPGLLADIKAATGVDLSLNQKAGKKGAGRKSQLTNLNNLSNNPRGRLEKKVLNKSAVDRVCMAMNALSKKRARQKFANQFNYTLKR